MTFDDELNARINALQRLRSLQPAVDRAAAMIAACLERGNKLLICGNGGSAAEAAHFATELVGRYQKTRASLPAIAVSADGSLLTCIGNDFGFDAVFSRQVEGLGKPGDIVVVLSSSGNSANLLQALDAAKRLKLETIALLGRGGGRAAGHATCELIMPGTAGAIAQEFHLFLIHYFCERIDASR